MSLTSAKQKQLNAKFIEICFDGHHFDVDRLISEGADIEAVERNGYTAISEASIAGHTVVVGQLLRALADPNKKAPDGRTALHRAAFHGWDNTIELLLKYGADPKTRDESGSTPADLARTPLLRQKIRDFPEEQTQEARAEWKRKLAERPPRPVPQVDDAESPADAKGDSKFKPPARNPAASKAEAEAKAKEEAKAKAEAKKKALAAAAKADKERREQRYRDAMAELHAQVANGDELGESGYNLADAPRPSNARMEVVGAGEKRLNGIYQVHFPTKDRIEFTKVDDESCQVFWSSYTDEWRMLIGDYKMGSTLYRHKYRPNWKADDCHGVPTSDWMKWYGKEGAPTVKLLPDLVEGSDTGSANNVDSTEGGEESAVNDTNRVEGSTGDAVSEKPVQQNSQFLEVNSMLNIVSKDDGVERRAAAAGAQSGSRKKEIQLTLGGERLIETADGLFSANEIQEEDSVSATIEEVDLVASLQAWMEKSATELPCTWEAIVAAKSAAQELYVEKKVLEAVQATSAALLALKKLEVVMQTDGESQIEADDALDDEARDGVEQAAHRPTEAEIEDFRGVLHSNRSLLLLHLIQASDAGVLKFGADAAWRLVVNDADLALRANPKNFKASFRRAKALLELGELEEALQDATVVVEHYANASSTPNPEAAALRERILAAIKKERAKWGDRGPRKWNRAF